MARLVGLSDILTFAKDEKETAEMVQLMVRSTHDLDQVIKDLTLILGIQKMNTQVFTDVNLEAVLEKVKQLLEEEIRQTDAWVDIQLAEEKIIHSLHPYIESIFYNLLSNAIKYRNPIRQPIIRIQSTVDHDNMVITIRDNGLGIDLERYKDKIFNLYKRFHYHVEGKGMGLYLVKTQVAALGGRIEVESVVGEGTTFRVSLQREHPSKNNAW
jgi:signal transduction histidine kinase